MTTIRQEVLANGLQIVFTDESNRYFGDYYRICVVATILCDLRNLPVESTDDEAFRRQSIDALGEQLSVVKHFVRMGVPSADVETVRCSLIDNFLGTAAAYLGRPEYPRKLVNAELNKHVKRGYYG